MQATRCPTCWVWGWMWPSLPCTVPQRPACLPWQLQTPLWTCPQVPASFLGSLAAHQESVQGRQIVGTLTVGSVMMADCRLLAPDVPALAAYHALQARTMQGLGVSDF